MYEVVSDPAVLSGANDVAQQSIAANDRHCATGAEREADEA